MKKNQKQVEKHLLQNEKEITDAIRKDYAGALSLVERRIAELTEQYEQNPELQSKVYQRQYQEKIKEQLESALNGLSESTLKNTTGYLELSYRDAFIGANYNIKAEGYDMFLPYDREKMNKAIYNSSGGFKLSKDAYDGDVDNLRKKLQSELSRGLNAGMSYAAISRMAASKMEVSYNSMKRIIATEGHRVQNEAKMDCMHDARNAGADIVKEWSATMDAATRMRHAILDGQIRELDDPFTALGAETQYPGGFGIAGEDINCRCVLLQRARWALNDKQLEQLESYSEYKKQYEEMQVLREQSESGIMRTQTELQQVANNIFSDIPQYTSSESKWSGRIVVDNQRLHELDAEGIKDWNCNIVLQSNATDATIWHEMLHSCSISHYDLITYGNCLKIEEASVEYLTKQICIAHNIPYEASYVELVAVLDTVNQKFGFGTDLEFAKELFNVPVTERYQWLENKVLDELSQSGATAIDANEVAEYIGLLGGE